MSERIAERLLWAVEVLDPTPSDRLLEIGCGHGVAVSLLCDRLSSGSVTAIDRSQPTIDRAIRRNRANVDAGKAVFEAVALEDADFGDERFDVAFAVNVQLFRANAERQAEVLRRALKAAGMLHLFQEHPSAERTRAVTQELTAALEQHSFAVRETLAAGAGASTRTCIVAVPQWDHSRS